MDELSLLRQFRADVSGPSDEARERALGFRGRRRRRVAVVGAVVVAAVVLVTSAFAVGWLPGSPAPKSVKKEISHLMRPTEETKGAILALQKPRQPRLLVGKTRLLTSIQTRRGRYVVWVVPRVDGRRCTFLQHVGERLLGSFACSARPQKLLPAGFTGGGITLIGGFAPPRTKTVEVRGAAGWGKKTLSVHRGFYFGQVQGPVALAVIARDAQGRILARSFPNRPVGPPPQRPIVRTERTALEITTRNGRKVSLVVGPGEGGTCVTWAGNLGAGQADCGPFPKHGLNAWIGQFGPAPKTFFFLEGRTGPGIRAIRLRFEDGTTTPVKFGLRVFLYEVKPRNYVKGHRPRVVIGLDRNGDVLARQRLGPWAS